VGSRGVANALSRWCGGRGRCQADRCVTRLNNDVDRMAARSDAHSAGAGSGLRSIRCKGRNVFDTEGKSTRPPSPQAGRALHHPARSAGQHEDGGQPQDDGAV